MFAGSVLVVIHLVFYPYSTVFSATSVHPDGEDHEEADPWGARASEDHFWGTDPEMLGCCFRPGLFTLKAIA